jgi:tetratricopeptide (TPR) repeat protein
VQLNAENAAAWQAWGVFEAGEGNLDKARSVLEAGLRRAPNHEPLLHALATVEMKHANYKRARRLLQLALTSHPVHAYSWLTLGELSYIEGDIEQARTIFRNMEYYCGRDSVQCASWAKIEAQLGEKGALPPSDAAVNCIPRMVFCRAPCCMLCTVAHVAVRILGLQRSWSRLGWGWTCLALCSQRECIG